MMAKRALLGNNSRALVRQQLSQQSKRGFSSSAGSTFGRSIAFGCGAAAVTGLTYINYMGHKAYMQATPEQRLDLFNPIVKTRVQKTFAYFGTACMSTGAIMFALRNSSIVTMNPWLLFAVSIGTMIGTRACDYEANFVMKNMFYAAFVGSIGVTLLPLVHIYAPAVLYDAALATGVTMGALSSVAYNAPSEQFLNWGGPLACGLGGMLGVSLLSILFPGSAALRSIWLYGGLVLFSGLTLFDVQMIMHRAKSQKIYDPINGSVDIYMDAVNLFVRFAQILGGSKRK